MEEIEYLHLEDDKVIAVTNILWTSSGFNDI